jgi:ATP-binding cassette, subfamily F, member 3
MIQLNSVSKGYLGQVLFENLTLLITPRDKLGLVGSNGSGKSTLMKMIARQIDPDKGSVDLARGTTVGYLPQDGVAATDRPLFEEAMSVFGELLDMEVEQHRLADRLKHLDPDSAEGRQVLERYGELQTAFQLRGGFALEAQVGQVLTGLGFSKSDWNKPVETFSGGWQMRVALAKLLLQKPNLLLLDEPTNHLDLEARNWLEAYLLEYPHAYLIVSHDRFFLDATVLRIADLFGRKLTLYTGGYTHYLGQREVNVEALLESHRRQQEHIEKLEHFINKFRYQATKAKQVQSRIKELEKIDRIVLPEGRKAIRFSFPQPPRSGRRVLELQAVRKCYGPLEVFHQVDLLIEQGEKIALVGPNGAGKSTLLRILIGQEPTDQGQRTIGHNVLLDYFAQDQDKVLDDRKTVLDTLMAVAPYDMVPHLRTLLGCFLFQGDDVFKKVAVLSGGERNRLALARMLLRPANLLLLDEPTNHLDMDAKEVLLNALQKFNGTVVFVSHDRYFIDRLATRVVEAGQGQLRSYLGNYEDYLWKKQQEDPESIAGIQIANDLRSWGKAPPVSKSAAPSAAEKADAAQPARGSEQNPNDRPVRVNPQKLQALTDRIAGIEEEIAAMESRIKIMERQMADADFFKDHQQAQDSLARWEEAQEVLKEKMRQWEKWIQEREEAESGLRR